MTSLESQDNPLRTLKQFYRPSLRKQMRHKRRNFPQIHSRQSSLVQMPNNKLQKSRETLQYLGELQKAKHIHRSFYHNDLYYPDPKKNYKQNPQFSKNSSYRSRKNKFKDQALRTISTDRQQFQKTFSSRKQRKQQLNCTFYNTRKKKDLYMEKFHQWQSLTERSSPTYQNMLGRALIEDHIMKEVKKNEHRFIYGY